MSEPQAERELRLPAKVVVSLRAGVVLAVANILCVVIIAWAYTKAQAGPKVLSVTGSAKKTIQSDLIQWRAKVFASDTDLVKGYDVLKAGADKTVAWLKGHGVNEREISLSSVWTKKNFVRDDKGNATDKVSSYELIQTIEVTSNDVARIATVSREATGLIKDGVQLESDAPSYLYTRMADLKITMLAEATKDAASRAQQIASNSGAKLGPVREARMGVMQINAVNANSVSDSGNNDTTSLEKDVTAVVSAKFELD